MQTAQNMKFVAISDTHGKHQAVNLPDGDCLIHAGDISPKGSEKRVLDFLQWFSERPHKHKIFIAGNHDFLFDGISDSELNKIIPENVIYLNENSVEIEGIKIFGSPISPWFFDWAFNRHRGADINKHWKIIPDDTNIIITHGPVWGILDLTLRNEKVGCEDLRNRVSEINPKYHICGHIHEAYGMIQKEHTCFINASLVNIQNQLVNEAIVFEY